MSIQDDLITIIDLANECAESIDSEAFDQLYDVGMIRDLHDMAHVITGGDRTRDWGWLAASLNPASPGDEPPRTPAWPDVKRRGIELLERLERGTTGGEG